MNAGRWANFPSSRIFQQKDNMTYPLQHHFDTRVTHHIDFSDLEELMKEVYGVVIEIGSANDTTHEFSVTKTEGGDYLKQGLEKQFLDDWMFHEVMDDMCFKGHIAPGDYYVRVSW